MKMETRKASIKKEWEPLTATHERELSRAKESFDDFVAGEAVDPLALVGAYRSGKTQLIYHLFNQSWERGIPAFYIGDPGLMLRQFDKSDNDDLNDWIEERIAAQLAAYAGGDADEIEWFPNVDSESKQEYIDQVADVVDEDDKTRTALFFDEVEQSYRAFIEVMDKDDDNPLRKINDGLQDSIKIWSFGMISAFEFIGEADWGRMKEIRIPPLKVHDVRDLLEERRPDAIDLANTIWWLARGRTGIIIKLIDELPADPQTNAIEWMEDLADADFRDTRLINNLWTELDREDWDAAITALLFREGGFDPWMISGEKALTAEQAQEIAVNIIKEEFKFEQTDTQRDAIAILDRNIERVCYGLAIGEDELIPQYGFSDEREGHAFLDLVTNMAVSFEPASDARKIALEALESVEGAFHTQWMYKAPDKELTDQTVVTASPKCVHDAFPPIAVNPARVSESLQDELEDKMERGLTLRTGTPDNELVDIKFCPTKETFRSELSELTNGYDISEPLVLVIPDKLSIEGLVTDEVRTYQRHRLLKIEEYQSNRFWTFVVNLFGRLQSERIREGYEIDQQIKEELLGVVGEREVRNTIETLYDQLDQVASDEIRTFAVKYREAYSLANTDTLLWKEERVQGDRPYWSNGKFVESTIALSYLPVFGPEYESGRQYSNLHSNLETAISQDLVSGGQNGFSFTDYLDDLFIQSGYSGSVTTERKHYREGSGLAPAVKQTQDTLTALSNLTDVSSIIQAIDDPDVKVADGQVLVLGMTNLSHLAYGLLRAILICGLTTGSDPDIDVASRLETVIADLKREKEKVDEYIERVEELNETLSPPDCADVGSWIQIDVNRLDQYESNLNSIINGSQDLKEKCEADSAAAPIGYHYWFLLKIYKEDISDEIDDLHSEINQADVDKIEDAIALFEHVYDSVEESEAIGMHFSSREALLSRLEDYGNTVFALEETLGATSLSIPEDRDELVDLNETVGTHTRYLTQLQQDIESIESQSKTIRSGVDDTKTKLRQLFERSEVVANE